jgi:hypothetical protein
MRQMRYALVILGTMAAAGVTRPALAQSIASAPLIPPVAKTVSLAGPRFGLTVMNDQTLAKLKERNIDVGSTISQFGWQFEREFYSKQAGPTVLNEWVVLLGGLDQGTAIPSLSWLVGLRTKEGAEFGVGPNITPGGVALAVAAGVTFRAGVVNVPMNFAVVPSKYGTRVSVLTGFVLRH